VAVFDFNGDVYPDIAVANGTYGTVGVLLNRGNGTFAYAMTYGAGSDPIAVAVADFNGDGVPDIVAANYGYPSASVSVLLGNGDGSFQPASSFAAPTFLTGLVVGDFNGDSIPDIALTNSPGGAESSTVSVLNGNGDGSFQTPVIYGVGDAKAVAVADLNNDGALDFAVVAARLATIFLNKGDGSFLGSPVGEDPSFVTVGDFNGDGIPDLAVANGYSNTISILLGNGDGTFQPAKNYDVGRNPASVAVADLRSNGIQDLVVADISSSTVSVLLGNGNGTFHAKKDYQVNSLPASVTVADLTGNSVPDIVVATKAVGTVSVLLGNGDGTFQAARDFPAGPSAVSVTVGDFTGDGNLDLAVANSIANNGTISVLLGNGNGTFQPPVSYPIGAYPYAVVVQDFNGDGTLDLAVSSLENKGTVSVLLGNGNGTFQAKRDYAAGNVGDGGGLVAADFNADGIPDLAVTNVNPDPVSVLLGNGDGSFQSPVTYSDGAGSGSVAAGDFNSDGAPDLALTTGASLGAVTMLLNAADWNTGTPGVPKKPRTGNHALAHLSLMLDSLSAQGVAQKSWKLHSLFVPINNQLFNAVPPGSVGINRSQSVPATAPPASALVSLTRQTPDTAWEQFTDPLTDELVLTLLK
jgi:hypothetical protein